MLPGGLLDEGQSLEQAAAKTLDDLLGLRSIQIRQIKTYSDIHRHPIKRVITTSFYALVKPESLRFQAQGYLSDAQWQTVSSINGLGFNHSEILRDAIYKLRQDVVFNPYGFELLPEKFTLKELQDLYEGILGEELDRRNFRRKVQALNLVTETSEKKTGVKGGPTLFVANTNLTSYNPLSTKRNN